jgi:hypothetical protein
MGTTYYDFGYVASGSASKEVQVNATFDEIDATIHGLGGGGGGATLTAHTQKRYATATVADRSGNVEASGDKITAAGGIWNGGVAPTSTHSVANEMSNGTSNWVGGYYGALNYIASGSNLQFWYSGYVTSLTDCRFFAGMSDTLGQTVPASDTPTGANFAMFRYSSTASDTNFQCITGDGTTLAIADSGVLPVIHQANVFAIEFVDATPAVKFYIDGTLVATSTTHLPGSSAILGYQCGVSCNTPNASLCGFSQVQIWSDR